MDIRQLQLPLASKPKVAKETLQWSGERKCKVTPVKRNWQTNWTYNAVTSLLLNDTFVRRTTYLEKTVETNFLLISLAVTTIADAFVYKGNVWANDQLSALGRNTRKNRLHKRATYASTQSSPKAQVYRTGAPIFLWTCTPYWILYRIFRISEL